MSSIWSKSSRWLIVTIKPDILECERDDLRRRRLEDLRKLADRDEFVDANGLSLRAPPRRRAPPRAPRACRDACRWRTARRRAAHGRHRLRDVGIHRFLIDRAALALFAATAAIRRRPHRLRHRHRRHHHRHRHHRHHHRLDRRPLVVATRRARHRRPALPRRWDAAGIRRCSRPGADAAHRA